MGVGRRGPLKCVSRWTGAAAVDPPEERRPLTDYDALGENKVGWALTAEDTAALTPAGNLGDPTVATAETGRRLLDAAVGNVVDLVSALEATD